MLVVGLAYSAALIFAWNLHFHLPGKHPEVAPKVRCKFVHAPRAHDSHEQGIPLCHHDNNRALPVNRQLGGWRRALALVLGAR
jgi:hypothetical protein